MTPGALRKLERELDAYFERLTQGFGRPERRRALSMYMLGLLLDGERKSMEPIAARLAEHDASAEGIRQRLQQCVCVSDWSEDELYRRIASEVHEQVASIEAFVLDDTGFPKKGTHSVGVARQYSGTLGRTDNCQVATSLHLAGERGSACIGMRLYLSEEWVADIERRKQTGVPEEVEFRTKWQIGLDLLDRALAWGSPRHVVLADAGYGDCTEFRTKLIERELPYVVAVMSQLKVWPPGSEPRVQPYSGRGRPPTRKIDRESPPRSLAEIAAEQSLRKVTWREGTRGRQSARFAALRIRSAHRACDGRAPGPEEWLLIEETKESKRPYKFYLSNLPASTSTRELVRLAKLRWRIERDYQEMKGELGLDHFEGRGWRGFHHHVALVAAAHAFLSIRRAVFPPEPRHEVDLAAGPARASASPAS